MTKPNEVASALHDGLVSPNESDSNLEPANVVDGLATAIEAQTKRDDENAF